MNTSLGRADPERDGTLFVLDLSALHIAPALPTVPLRAGTADDIASLEAAMHASGEYSDSVVQSRLDDGRHPYIIEADGLIVSYGWVALSAEPIGDLGLSFRLGTQEAYIYDCATRPEYRGRGYYTALLRGISAELARKRLRRAWIGTAPGNHISQRGIVRAGFTKVADVNFSRPPDGSLRVNLYGVPGVPSDLLDHAAWSFHGYAHPDMGIPAGGF